MHSVFLSYSFKNENEPLVKTVRSIIDAVGFRVIDGKILDTNQVGSGVTEKLKKCYGAVCLLTKEAFQSGWVDAEFWQAVGANINVCLLCDSSLTLGNAYQGRVKFPFDDTDSLKAVELLSGTLGLWKQTAGNTARVLLLPREIGEEAIQQNARCEYRYINDMSADESEWQEARLVPYVAGVQAILPKVPANHSVKVKLTYSQRVIDSPYTPQQITLQLR